MDHIDYGSNHINCIDWIMILYQVRITFNSNLVEISSVSIPMWTLCVRNLNTNICLETNTSLDKILIYLIVINIDIYTSMQMNLDLNITSIYIYNEKCN